MTMYIPLPALRTPCARSQVPGMVEKCGYKVATALLEIA